MIAATDQEVDEVVVDGKGRAGQLTGESVAKEYLAVMAPVVGIEETLACVFDPSLMLGDLARRES